MLPTRLHALRRLAMAAALLVGSTFLVSAQSVPTIDALIIVNADVPTTSIRLVELRDILLGEKQHWAPGLRVTVFRPPSGPDWEIVLARAVRLSPLSYTRRLQGNTYSGIASSAPRIVPSVEARKRLVADTPGGLAIIPAGPVDPSVKVLKVEGIGPGEAGYPFGR